LKEYTGKEIILGIRPEHITLSLNQEYSSDFPVQIGVLEPIGSDTFVYIDFPGKIVMTVKLEGLTKFTLNQSIFARFDDEQIHFFDIDSEERIQPIKE
jgi:multiple sugar transport system ATP-binding protein